MYPSVKREVPEFIEKYLAYCDCFIDINRQKSCWVLTRNLKFLEFSQKQLVASLDLQSTCLSKIKENIQNYNGPRGKWYETSITESTMIENTLDQISFGKYIFHALNIYKIYVIIQCWDKCIVLKRLPDFKGFELKVEYENVQSYRIIHGPIKFCPILEFQFLNNETRKTDFEDEPLASDSHNLDQKKSEIRQLLERIRSAKTELQLHESITAHSFHSLQNNLTLGQPFLRSFKLEEKQMLSRCGDIWKRFTAHDDLVIGIPLVNQCAAPNLSIIRNLIPVLQPNESTVSSVQMQYRLFQLNLKFDELDTLESYLESEDDQLQGNIWCSNGDLQILPESYVVLLIKLKISQIILLKQSILILNYEVVRNLASNSTHIMPLQLFLQHLDFQKILFEERPQSELKFLSQTLHQDFLTIAMTSQEINFKITFENCMDLNNFEHFIQENLNFIKPPAMPDCNASTVNFNLVFYNKTPSSIWFGSLILRIKPLTEEDSEHCQTTWRIYCQTFDKALLLLKTFLSDLLTVQCNILSISTCDNDRRPDKCINEFENALRQELQQLQEMVHNIKIKKYSEEHLQNLEKLCQLQMNSDIIASNMMNNEIS